MIPRQFHFVFGLKKRPERFHLAYYLCLASCRAVNEPDRIFFHCHHEPYGRYWELIRDSVTLVPVAPDRFVEDYRYPERSLDRYRYAHHADVVRLDALIEHGGVYADIDTLFVHPWPDTLWRHPCVLGREDDVVCQRAGAIKASVCNAIIGSERGARFTRAWRDAIYGAFDGSWSNHSGFLAAELSRTQPETVHLEPSRTFYKHMFTPDGIHMLFEGLDADFSGVLSMHLWSHLWWHRRRRDFSAFHAGRLTEDYVRQADTTYSIAARPFLPPSRRSRVALSASALRGLFGRRRGHGRHE
jgi:hypothetical protein